MVGGWRAGGWVAAGGWRWVPVGGDCGGGWVAGVVVAGGRLVGGGGRVGGDCELMVVVGRWRRGWVVVVLVGGEWVAGGDGRGTMGWRVGWCCQCGAGRVAGEWEWRSGGVAAG